LQIRQRIKFYKALMGTTAAVFADHVELSDGGVDFASEIGTGGVPGTKFIWPEDDALRQRLSAWWALTPQKRLHWKMWLEIYAQHRLAEGECLNLYDLAFDLPEAHAIRKDNALYYAFYTPAADQTYRGEIVLRGLGDCPHQLRDYVRARSLGIVHGPVASLQVVFQGSLLLQAIPEK
jgi:alpha-galactosidase